MKRIPCGVLVEYDSATETRNFSLLMNTPLNRRHFLRLAALASLAAAKPLHSLPRSRAREAHRSGRG